MRRSLLLVVALGGMWVACGGDQDLGGAITECHFEISPVVDHEYGTTVVVDSWVDSPFVGFRAWDWAVAFEGSAVEYRERNTDGSSIEFEPMVPGVYTVSLLGTVGDAECVGSSQGINVLPPDAGSRAVDIRVFGGEAPVWARYTIYGDVEYTVGDIDLAALSRVRQFQVVDSFGAGVAAHVQFRSPGGGENAIVDAAVPESGRPIRLADSILEATVFPADTSLAPTWALLDPTESTLALGASVTVSGAVVDSSAVPMEGARVVLRTDGIGSTVGVTDAAGNYALRTRPGLATLSVFAPEGAMLPELTAVVGTITTNEQIDVSFGPVALRGVDAVVEVLGQSQAGASVQLSADSADAGTILVAGSPVSASGEFDLTLIADGAGRIVHAGVPARAFDAAVVGLTAGMSTFDLTISSPATLAVPPNRQLLGRLVNDGGMPVSGQVSVIATGELARWKGQRVAVGSNGEFSISVPVGASIIATVPANPAEGLARRYFEVVVPSDANAAVGNVLLGAVMPVVGRVIDGGLPVAGAVVTAGCAGCGPRYLAEAVTDLAGEFTLLVEVP